MTAERLVKSNTFAFLDIDTGIETSISHMDNK